MKFLFQLAFSEKKYLLMIVFALVAMIGTTIGTQMEIVTLGVLTSDPHEVIEGQGQKGLVDRAIYTLNYFFDISENPMMLACLMLAVALFNATTMFFHRYCTRMTSTRVSSDLRQRYFEHIQTLSMSFYGKQNIGGLSSRVVADAVAISDGVNAALTNYLQTPFAVLSTLVLCFIASWKLTLMVFFGLPLLALPITFISRRIKRITKHLQKNQETFSAVLIDFLAGIQTVKIFGKEQYSLEKYSQENERMEELQKRIAKYDVSSRPVVHTIGMTFLASALLAGLYLFEMSVPEVIVYCGLLYIFYEPIKKFAETNATIQRGAAAAERMQEVLETTPDIQDAPRALEIETFTSHITFRDVWFRYGSEWVLRGVNFTVKKGQTVALVGPTGAGKSTIVQLLPRLYEVERGEIEIDGKPLSAYTQSSLRGLMAYVPQKPFLFLDTIARNISFGEPYTHQEIREAAQKAHAAEFIERLPEQYETLLSEMGKNLSGGQQQRLAIARALFKQAPILVLDEATSSLDAVSEQHIKEAVKNLKGEMTQILIAHRLSTVEDADLILYLDQGKVVAQGNKEELLKTCPPFKTMWELMQKPAYA